MGFWSRAWKVATGIGSTVQAPFGLVKDVATSPWRDEKEFDGFWNVLWGRSLARGGQAMGNFMGPDEGLGALIGGLPEPGLRQAGRLVGTGLNALETGYREGIAEPISTALTVGSLADAPSGGGIGGLFNLDFWREGYRTAQTRSPGQAFALAFGTKNINDPDEVNKYVGTDQYKMASGLSDAVIRFLVDPGVVAGKAKTAFVAGRTTITRADDIARVTASGGYRRTLQSMEGKNAVELRDQYFPNHPQGAAIATVLELAPTYEARDAAMKVMLGDLGEARKVVAKHAVLADRLENLMNENSTIQYMERQGGLGEFGVNAPEYVARVKAATKEVHPEVEDAARLQGVFGTIGRTRWATDIGRVRSQVRATLSRNDFYQRNWLASPVRRAFTMRPHSMVNLHDQASDVQARRVLTKSGMPREMQDDLARAYMREVTPEGRQAALIRIEEESVRFVLKAHSAPDADVDKILAEATKNRQLAQTKLNSRAFVGEGASEYEFIDDAGITHKVPLLVSQTANMLPLADLDRLGRLAKRDGEGWVRHAATEGFETATDLLEGYYKMWKPAVLLRVGWPMRVVTDEQLRIIAKIGALSQLNNVVGTGAYRLKQYVEHIPDIRAAMKGVDDVPGMGLRAAFKQVRTDMGPATRGVNVRGYDIASAFGTTGDNANIYQELVRSNASFQKFFGRSEEAIYKSLTENTEDWKSISPVSSDPAERASYGSAWEHAVNRQFGQDAMARQFLDGRTVDEVTDWLTDTTEGKVYASRLSIRASNPRGWAQDVSDVVDSYTLGDDTIKQLALKGKARARHMEKAAPDAANRPVIHGEIIEQATGGSKVVQKWNQVVEKGYRALGSLPSDTLSRNRYFDHMYRAEATRMVNVIADQLKPGEVLDETMLRHVESRSREYALTETRKLLYDLAETSDLAHTLRFFAPFYSAWQEVLTRWAGIAVENPAFVRRTQLIWQAPEKMGLLTDEDGQEVRWGEPRDGDTYITIPLPGWVDKIPVFGQGMRTSAEPGRVRFNRKSFNIAMTGMPGLGPVVQVPVNEIVKNRPELEDSVKFVLPYGPTQETWRLLIPPAIQKAYTAGRGEEDRLFMNSAIRIYLDMQVDRNLGKRDTEPTFEEALDQAQKLANVRVWASYISPAAPQFQSPYQVYIDAYRQLKEADPETADDKFLAQFGEEFFPLTESATRSMDGVMPTLEGFEARKKYEDLIEKDPELGALIVGAEGAGEFSRAVYDYQLARGVAPGSADNQREGKSFTEVDPDRRLGWIYFTKGMDLIDAMMIERGLPNLQVKAAAEIAQRKKLLIAVLAERFPSWYDDFQDNDEGKWRKRFDAFEAITKDERLAKRDDIRGLATYMQARDLLLKVLEERRAAGGAGTLASAKNADLKAAWSTITSKLVEGNLAFGALYNRWLANDPLEREAESVEEILRVVPQTSSGMGGPPGFIGGSSGQFGGGGPPNLIGSGR